MSCVFTPTRCHIKLGAIVRNFHRLGSAETLMPVIKSDAYGHGLVPVAKALDSAGARAFAVGGASEGAELRKEGLKQEILLLMGCMDANDWLLARNKGLIALVGDFGELEMAAGVCGGAELPIALKCDTGMSRLGFDLDEAPALIEKLREFPLLRPTLLVSHLACADAPAEKDFTLGQTKIFDSFYAALKPYFPALRRSLCNSAGAISLDERRHEYCRPGLAIYGGDPFFGTPLEGSGGELEWAMSISSPIIQIRQLKSGQSVSYGRIFTSKKPMRIAIAACGYANGLNRDLSNRMSALVAGRRAPQIGRICMSMLMLDISGIESVKPGDPVWIMGGKALAGEKPVSAQEMANALNTIPYEPLCLLGSLNPRIYE